MQMQITQRKFRPQFNGEARSFFFFFWKAPSEVVLICFPTTLLQKQSEQPSERKTRLELSDADRSPGSRVMSRVSSEAAPLLVQGQRPKYPTPSRTS